MASEMKKPALAKDYEENGVIVSITAQNDKPTKCRTFLNPKMGICREFVLASLKVHCDGQGEDIMVKCLDAFGATGIGGLQWKKQLKNKVEVTINDISPLSVSDIRDNCERNGMTVEAMRLPEGLDVHQTIQSNEPTDNGIELTSADANVIMHLRQFGFIHVDPYGSTVNYLDAAFRNIYNKGLMVITSTDVSAIYGKCPQVTQRSYGAYTQKNDYYKEMAARVVLAAVARAAARCNKGLEVMYTVAVEHFVQAGVRIKRGAKHADETLTHIRGVLQCQMCEEYAILPGRQVPTENVYDCLPCDCHRTHPGKTAIELGPMWCGDLFDHSFMEKMQKAAVDLNLSVRMQSLLHGMAVEAACPLEDIKETNSHNKNVLSTSSIGAKNKGAKEVQGNSAKCDAGNGSEAKIQTEAVTKSEAKPQNEANTDKETKTQVTQNECQIKTDAPGESATETQSQSTSESKKRKNIEDNPSEPKAKKAKRPSRIPDDKMPFFYYDIHRRKIKGWDIPKANKFVVLLHQEGYRACRTTFDPTAIRTNATLSEVKDVIYRCCSKTPKGDKS